MVDYECVGTDSLENMQHFHPAVNKYQNEHIYFICHM